MTDTATAQDFVDEAVDFMPGVDMTYDNSTGEIDFMPNEEGLASLQEAIENEPEATSEPEPAKESEPTTDWEARYKGLQSKVTQTFQEHAELKRRLDEIENERTVQTQTSTQEQAKASLKETIKKLWDEHEGQIDGEAFAQMLQTAVEAHRGQIDDTLSPIQKEVKQLREQAEAQAEAMRIVSHYGPERLKVLSPWVTRAMQQNRQAFERFTLPQVYEYVDKLERQGVLGPNPVANAQREQQSTPSSEAEARTRDFKAEQEQMTTEQSYAPSGVDGPTPPAAKSFDDAIDRAFAHLELA